MPRVPTAKPTVRTFFICECCDEFDDTRRMPPARQRSQAFCCRNPRPLGTQAVVQDRRPMAANRRAQDSGEEAPEPTETCGGRKVPSRLVPVIVTYRPIQKSIECFGVLIEVHRSEHDA